MSRLTLYFLLILSICNPTFAAGEPKVGSDIYQKAPILQKHLVASDFVNDNRDQIKKLQTQLNDLGFFVGTADGVIGKKTQAGVIAFLRRFNKQPSGSLTTSTFEQISKVHSARFSSPFVPNLLLRPTDYLPSRKVYTSDIRKDVDNCDECRVTTFMLASGDMDGDGIDEIVLSTHRHDETWSVINETSPLTIVSFKEGKGVRFSGILGKKLPSRVHEREGIIRDFNGDGLGDLFVAAHGHDAQPFYGEQNILLLSTRNGHIDASLTHLPKLSDMAHGVDASDIDGDGDLDLMIVTNENANNILPYMLINDGQGKFNRTDIGYFLDKSLIDFTKKSRKHRAQYSTVRLKDLNDDSFPDMLLLARGEDPQGATKFKSSRLSLLIYNDGSGKFPNKNIVELPTDRWGYGTFTNDAEVVDIDGDGLKDILLTQSTRLKNGGAWRGHYLQLLMNENGKYIDRSAERLWPQGYAPNPDNFQFADKTIIADIDADGDFDLVTRSLGPSFKQNFTDAIVQIGINNGDGIFLPADPDWFTGGYDHRGIAPIVGDFNGDGISDIASNKLNYIIHKDQTLGVHISVHIIASPK